MLSTFQVFDAQDEVLRYDYRQKQKAAMHIVRTMK